MITKVTHLIKSTTTTLGMGIQVTLDLEKVTNTIAIQWQRDFSPNDYTSMSP